MILIFFILSL
jgi:hypothetical protein